MAKRRHWPDHELIGKKVEYKTERETSSVEIVDVKAGPMFLDTSAGFLDAPEAKIHGSIQLRLRHVDSGAEFWSPPMRYRSATPEVANG